MRRSCSIRILDLKFKLQILLSFIVIAISPFIISPVFASPLLQADDPVAQCAKGVQYYEMGEYEKALPLLEAGIAGHNAATFNDKDDLGICALYLGILYKDSSKLEAALTAYTVALEAFRSSGNRVQEAMTKQNIGVTYEYQGFYADALNHYQQALQIVREEHERFGEGVLLDNIGFIYYAQGRHAEALNYYQQALVIEREVMDRIGEGLTLDNIGSLYWEQGRITEALSYYQQSLVIKRAENDRIGEETTLNNLGLALEAQGRYDEALDYYAQALTIQGQENDLFRQGSTLHNVGMVYLDEGRHADALDYFLQSLEIRRRIGDRAAEAITLNSLGLVSEFQGNNSEALDYYQQALNIVRQVGNQVVEGVVLVNIGSTYQNAHELNEASMYYEEAMSLFEIVRASAGSEESRTGFIDQYADLYSLAVDLFHEQGQNDHAFFITERGRARAFLDSLATGTIELSDNEAATLYSQEQEAYAVRQIAQDAVSRAKAEDPPDEKKISELEGQLAQAEIGLQASRDAITSYGGQLAELISGRNTVLDLQKTQALLDDETTLVSFWVLDERTLVFILTHNDFHTVELNISYGDLSNQIAAFRAFSNTQDPYPDSAITLYNSLILPIKPLLKSQHLIFIPHNILHYLPFAVLTDGNHYLVDDYVITYLPSASALPFIQENAEGIGGHPLIIGNPITGDFDPTASLAAERDQLGPLPFAEEEAKDVANQLGVQPFLEEDATETLVKKQASQTQILHLAAHGLFNPAAPLNSLVALAPDQENDGWLTVGEVYGLDLENTGLVVLSACETQIGQLTAGDEFVGLTRGFFFAGTPTVVASLWNVDDKATALLMERFYTHLQDGMGKGEALGQAQLDVREQYPNPYYWAAFVLTGDPGEVAAIKSDAVTQTPMPAQTPTSSPVRFPACAVGLSLLLLPIAFLWLTTNRVRSL